jgi:hypothetical protein
MDERQKIDWGLQAKKLLLQLEKRQALPTNHPYSMAALDEEIAAVEELISSYRLLFANERIESPTASVAPPLIAPEDRLNLFRAASQPDRLGSFPGGSP